MTFEQAEVGGYTVAGFEEDDIAGNKKGGVEGLPVAVAQHRGFGGKKRFDGIEGLLGFAFLNNADDAVDQDHSENDAGIGPLPEESRAEGGREEDVDQNIMKLQEEALEQRITGRFGQLVGSVLPPPDRGRTRLEALAGLDVQSAEGVLGVLLMRVHGGNIKFPRRTNGCNPKPTRPCPCIVGGKIVLCEGEKFADKQRLSIWVLTNWGCQTR